jgi:hypothetical protein
LEEVMSVYEKEEVKIVIDEMKQVLEKNESKLLTILDQVTAARMELNTTEAYSTLIAAQNDLSQINLIGVIDTLEGILQDSGALPSL